ncbi:MAG: glucosaminidase domain-containing protein [Thermodesulfobacteriota bacterium]
MKHSTAHERLEKISPHRHQAGKPHQPALFGSRSVDPDMVRFVAGAMLAVVLLVLAVLRPPMDLLLSRYQFSDALQIIRVRSSEKLVEKLQALSLWEVSPRAEVPPVVFTQFPDDFGRIDFDLKKRVFLHTLLPVAMVANAEVEQERATLLSLLDKMGDCDPDALLADREADIKSSGLNKSELYFLQQLGDKYRTTRMDELVRRVNVVPVSLILAQGALESSWGGSRFASEGNNLFGVWTWGKSGMMPQRREAGKRHLVAMYDTILDSARSYLLMINRQAAYREFRALREQTMDPLRLAHGLLRYSEKRDAYVAGLQSFIQQNRLQQYDECVLASGLGGRDARALRLASLSD